MGDPEGSGGREGAGAGGGGGGGRETVELIDSETISCCPNVKKSYHILFLCLGDVGLVLKVSS